MVQSQNYHRQILHGDVIDKLKEIPNGTFDCIITSPPYWQLRDYSSEGQWGLEPTFQEYLEKMKLFMIQLKRVLKDTGTCFINLGDTYSTGIGTIQAKSRIGIPSRFYINCIDSGWISRNDLIWAKMNAMPQSVKDRFTNKYEPVYFFTKNQKYYFNLDGVRVPTQNDQRSYNSNIKNATNSVQQTLWCNETDYIDNTVDSTITEKYDKDSNVGRLHKDRKGNPNKQDETLGSDGKPKATYKGFNDRWKTKGQLLRETWMSRNGGKGSTLGNRKYAEQSISKINSNNYSMETGESLNHPKGKNPGDLIFDNCAREELHECVDIFCDINYSWEQAPPDLFFINPKPTKGNHHASFPVALPQRFLKCACPKEVCVKCGYPKIPKLRPTESYQKYLDSIRYAGTRSLEVGLQDFKKNLPTCNSQYEIVGYDACECNDEFIPGIVLDPFFGSGTTGIAAEIEGVRWCGIELKPEYSEIAKRRLSKYVTQGSLMK